MKYNGNKLSNDLSEKYNWPESTIQRFLKTYGKRTKKILNALMTPSKNFSIRTNTLKISSENLIIQLKKLGIKAKRHKIIPEAILLPVKGPFKIPTLEKKVIVNKFATESIICGSDLYIPGIQKFDKFKEGDEVTIISDTKINVAIGIAKKNYKEIEKNKKGIAFQTIRSLYSIPKVKNYQIYEMGFFYNQSLPSILASKILDPQKDELIADLCAGNGGKTTHIAQLMENQGKIIAVDRSKNKIEKLNQNMFRLGIKNITTKAGDAKCLLPEFTHLADRVLIDPPCTDFGVRPKLYETKKEQDIINCAKYQKYFINLAKEIVKLGGIIVYCTCTFPIEENELNIKYMVEKLKFKIIDQKYYVGARGEHIEKGFKTNLLQRFYPDIHETSGFFIAKLEAPK